MTSSIRDDDEVIARLEALHAPWRARLPDEVEAKYRKMAKDAFGYFRGTAPLFHDALQRERSPFIDDPERWLLLNGDVHLENYGARRDAAGVAVFDLADFDEAAYGPVVHDIWRLATSLVLAARPRGLSDQAIGEALHELAEHYGRALAAFAGDEAEPSQARLTAADASGPIRKRIARLAKKSADELLVDIGRSDKWRAVPGERQPAFAAALADYQQRLPGRQPALQLLDIHERLGAGNGSLGRHRYHLRVEAEDGGALVLEFKEQAPSALHLAVTTRPEPLLPHHHGQRVAEAIRSLQSHPDARTGWTTLDGLPFLVREKSPFESSLDCDKLAGTRDWKTTARHTAQVLAKTHALRRRLMNRRFVFIKTSEMHLKNKMSEF